jgi:endonuclease III
MAITMNKQKVVTQLFGALSKLGKAAEEPPARPVLEQFIYAVCREGTTREQADQAYRALQTRFFDWNEIRVSAPEEITEVLTGLVPDPEKRAQRIIDFLQEVFETTFAFDLEGLQKKGLKQAAKQLARYQSANDYVVAWVTQQSLGGHAIPLDEVTTRVLRRLRLIDDGQADMEVVRASLEHQIPKAKGTLFVDLISSVGQQWCHEHRPACPSCPARPHCPTGQQLTARVTNKKPR